MDGWKRTDTSIFESTLNPATRRHGGMHYTSIENIHKVIDPLFLDAYKERFHEAMQEKQTKRRIERLRDLQRDLGRGQYFDPACGSGNFLTESYLSLRRLENDILRETLMGESGTGVLGLDFAGSSEEDYVHVSIQQFHGIEINDFATSVAKTALWIAESQMFRETEDIIHKEMDFLPLHTNSNIHEGNALRMDWKSVLPPSDDVKILGNPPFVGARLMEPMQKEDLKAAFGPDIPQNQVQTFDGTIQFNGTKKYDGWKNLGNLDYVTGWYKKAADYMEKTAIHAAFVSTNSITQGEQVAILWQPLFDRKLQFDFAYRTFRWDSESTKKAHVHCVIIGFSYAQKNADKNPQKFIDNKGMKHLAKNINAYLIDAPNVFVESRKKPLCDVPSIGIGNQPIDDGNYLFKKEEMDDFLKLEPKAEKYFHPWYGSQEFINRRPRYCLWLGDCNPKELLQMPHCLERVENVRNFRLSSKRKSTVKIADVPTHFQTENMPKGNYIVVPKVSSQNRRYIPLGYMDDSVLCSDLVFLIPNTTLYHFGILESNVHMAWMRTVAGRLKSDYRYSKDIVYNNFPWPTPTPEQRAEIERTAQGILDARANHPDSSFADMYGEHMYLYPDLLEAHRANDRATLRAYGFPLKITEPDCVAELMKRYEELAKE